MAKRKCLNERRLTRKQVEAIIASEGKFHPEYSAISGCLIYELPSDRFLQVFDPNGSLLPGKGDIYPKEYFVRSIRWTQKVKEDYANDRGNSVAHWRYYSQNKIDLVHRIDELIEELAKCWQISRSELNYSYKSLDIVSENAEEFGLEKVYSELYDNLVAYVGEVLRRRVDGNWAIREDYPGCDYPIIKVGERLLMPINVVWTEIDGLEPVNLRRETANEVRRFSLSYY